MATKHRTGYLFKRGGTYYLEYMVEGKRIKQSLRTHVLRKAKSERDRIMKPLEVAQKGDALRAVVQKPTQRTINGAPRAWNEPVDPHLPMAVVPVQMRDKEP